jgi:hypothetical protein
MIIFPVVLQANTEHSLKLPFKFTSLNITKAVSCGGHQTQGPAKRKLPAGAGLCPANLKLQRVGLVTEKGSAIIKFWLLTLRQKFTSLTQIHISSSFRTSKAPGVSSYVPIFFRSANYNRTHPLANRDTAWRRQQQRRQRWQHHGVDCRGKIQIQTQVPWLFRVLACNKVCILPSLT